MNKRQSGTAYPDWIAVGMTNSGMVRANNEDVYYCDDEQGIYIVIDGMGGHRAGEVAAQIALDTIQRELSKIDKTPTKERIRQAVIAANNLIIEQSETHQEWRNMQCVLTVAMQEGDQIVIGHVGDTRLYKICGDKIRKVTHDHSPSGMLEEMHQMSELEAMQLPNRNEVYRSLGAEYIQLDNNEFVELHTEPVLANESILICSDGLSDCLTSEHIRDIIKQHKPYSGSIVNHLIQAANNAGGKDNITVIYAQRVSRKQANTLPRHGSIAKFAILCLVVLAVAILWYLNPFANHNPELQMPSDASVTKVSTKPQSIPDVSVSISPQHSNTHADQAQNYNDEASLIQQDKSNANEYFNKGILLNEQQKIEMAAKYFMVAALLDQNNEEARKQYCSLRKRLSENYGQCLRCNQ